MKYTNNKSEDLKSPKKGLEVPFHNVKLKDPENILEWIDYLQKMKPQTNALVTGIMLILFNGMHLGWGIFNNSIGSLGLQSHEMFWLIGGWFVAAIFGFFLAASMIRKHSKITLYVSYNVLCNLCNFNVLLISLCL